MIKLRSILSVFLILLLIQLIQPKVTFGEEKKADKKEITVNATGAILLDSETGRILWEKNARLPLPMASTTKIMTALLTLEKGNLEDKVKVSRRASLAPKVKMFLQEGEEIPLKGLLYALMLQSSNDAAVAIAEHIGGSVEEFCNMMTQRARELGAMDTVFETPNGLDKGDHHSTAYDLALITRFALQNQDLIQIITTPEITAESSRTSYTIINKNRLLREYAGAIGVKTGFTGKAGHCFVGAAKRDGMQLISVVLASGWGEKGKEQKWRDTKALLNFGFDNFKYVDVIEAKKRVGRIPVTRAKEEDIEFYLAEGLVLPLMEDELSQVHVKYVLPEKLLAPVKENQVIGFAEVYLNDEVIKEIKLLASQAVKRHDFETYIREIMDYWIGMGTNAS